MGKRSENPEFVRARAVVAGLARAASMTPEELSEAGRKAARARWDKRPPAVKPPKPTPEERAQSARAAMRAAQQLDEEE